jgi:hypothetical protein
MLFEYKNINEKKWPLILGKNSLEYSPPKTVHMPIQPVHSADLIHVDCALNVCRRRVFPDLSSHDISVCPAPVIYEWTPAKPFMQNDTFLVQFAFEDPPFVPDFQLVKMQLHQGRYPIVKAEYFAWDMYYTLEYFCCPTEDNQQSLLWITCSVTNESQNAQDAHVWTKVNFNSEKNLFDYHYVPFYWDATKWLPCNKVSLDGTEIIYNNNAIGRILPSKFAYEWKENYHNEDLDYNKKHIWGTPYYVEPSMRLKNIDDTIHFYTRLEPGQTEKFNITLLTNFEQISNKHRIFLSEADPNECRERALEHFKSQLPPNCTHLTCKSENIDSIFTELQLSTKQLLLKFPEKSGMMPTQGGSSERHFVWVWEAIWMLIPMLKLGHFDDVRQALDFIFELQDAGCPPEGDFTTTEGAIGTTGPRWANSTASALALAADYFSYSKDKAFMETYLAKMLKAANWIVNEIKATRKLNNDNTRPPWYGLMPFARSTDGDMGYVVSFTDTSTFWGLEKFICVLEKIEHNLASEFRKELRQYQQDIAIAVENMTRPDGYIARCLKTNTDEGFINSKFENVCSSVQLGYTNTIDVNSDIFQNFIKYVEENVADGPFLGKMDRDVVYIGCAEYYWHDIYLRLGQWKKAFLTFITCLKYGMTQDTYQVQERLSKTNPAYTPWQPNGSGNGRLLDMIVKSFYFEDEQRVILLGGIPFSWIKENHTTTIQNLHTHQGQINLEAKIIDDNCFTLELKASSGKVIPKSIQFPEHLKVQSNSPYVKEQTTGCFLLTKEIDNLTFTLSENDG